MKLTPRFMPKGYHSVICRMICLVYLDAMSCRWYISCTLVDGMMDEFLNKFCIQIIVIRRGLMSRKKIAIVFVFISGRIFLRNFNKHFSKIFARSNFPKSRKSNFLPNDFLSNSVDNTAKSWLMCSQ